jgi:glyoxylase-like metal-dependent hydrolase (beta-lactamase superfamily II)
MSKSLQVTAVLGAALGAAIAAPAAAAPPPRLSVSVYTGSPAGFLVNSTLVAGDKDAILIDAQFDLADAHRLVAMILETKKNLTTVYVTHSHADDAARAANRDPSQIRRLYNVPAPPRLQARDQADRWADQLIQISTRYGISGFRLFSDDHQTISQFGNDVAPRVRAATS